jgi:anti-sigma regulatory factor (Ser/Thr protein kinase)
MYSMRLPAAVEDSRSARQLATAWLHDAGADERLVEDAAVVVAELVMNAITARADTAVVLRLELRGAWLRVEVDDEGSGMPRPRAGGEDGGWGLQLVDALADEWGTDRHDDHGKTVWAELRAAS